MNLGPRGEALIKSFETLRLTAYMPTPNDRPTIGWGSTRGVTMGMTITLEQAQARFADDTAQAVSAVNATHCNLSQSAFDALVSFVFNDGVGAIGPGMIAGRALAAWKATGSPKHLFDICKGFTEWDEQAHEEMRGLARRRYMEAALFMEDPFPPRSGD